MILFVRNVQNRQIHRAPKEKGGCQGLGHETEARVTASGDRAPHQDEEDVQE